MVGSGEASFQNTLLAPVAALVRSRNRVPDWRLLPSVSTAHHTGSPGHILMLAERYLHLLYNFNATEWCITFQ